MSLFYTRNIEMWCYPLSPWLSASYENEFKIMGQPIDFQRVTKRFTFFYIYYNIVYILLQTYYDACKIIIM